MYFFNPVWPDASMHCNGVVKLQFGPILILFVLQMGAIYSMLKGKKKKQKEQ